MIIIKCPKCFRYDRGKIKVRFFENRWAKWFAGTCQECNNEFKLRDFEFDLIQPDSSFFEPIYKFNPELQAQKKRKEKEFAEEQRKAELEKKYFNKYVRKTGGISSTRKTNEYKKIKQVVLED